MTKNAREWAAIHDRRLGEEEEQEAYEHNDRADKWALEHRWLHKKGYTEETVEPDGKFEELRDKTVELSTAMAVYAKYLNRYDWSRVDMEILAMLTNQTDMLLETLFAYTREG